MKEAKTVLHTKTEIDGKEQEVLIMPITRLDCIEDTAEIKKAVADKDYIPVIDSADDGQMKKISVENLIPKGDVTGLPVPTDFSVPVSAWMASEDPDFPFAAEITASGVTAADSADVRFDKASIKFAGAAGVFTGETAAGKITLLAEKTPTAVLSGVYICAKGAAE